MKKQIYFFATIVTIIIILDQLTKFLIQKIMPIWNISFLKIHFVKNTGAGFGILQGKPILLGIISLIVALIIIFTYSKIPKEKVPQLLFAIFLGGVIGNMIDRLFRQFVIDFIDLGFWPAFNIADAAISIAAIGLVIYFWKK